MCEHATQGTAEGDQARSMLDVQVHHGRLFHPEESPDSSSSQSLLHSLLGVKQPPSEETLMSSQAEDDGGGGRLCTQCQTITNGREEHE